MGLERWAGEGEREMKIQCTVGRLVQNTAKPTDPDKPLPVSHEVRLVTHPHVGDIELKSEAEEFAAWAKSLQGGQKVTLEFYPT